MADKTKTVTVTQIKRAIGRRNDQRETFRGLKLNKIHRSSKYSFINFAKNKIDKINYRFPLFKDKDNIEKKIFSINFYESIVEIGRAHV